MIIHVSAFNFNESTSKEEAERLLEGVRGIEVSGVHEVACGRNSSPLTQGLEYAVYCRADDVAALDRYRAHEAHVAAAAAMDLSQSREDGHQPGLVVDVEYQPK